MSERVMLNRAAVVAIQRGNVPQSATVKILPFGKPLDLVVVGNRPRPSIEVLLCNGASPRTSLPRRSHLPCTPEYDKPNASAMVKHMRKLEAVLLAASRSRYSHTPPHHSLSIVKKFSYCDTSKSAVPFELSTGLINQIQASPNVSFPEEEPTEEHDPDKPSPAQLAFILQTLREEVG